MPAKKNERPSLKKKNSVDKDSSMDNLLKATSASAIVESLLGNSHNGSGRRSLRKSLTNHPDSQETIDESEDEISKGEELEELKLAAVKDEKASAQNVNVKYGTKGKNLIDMDKVTPEQLEEHYKQCIGLFSKNKVNTKNAFSLQLINFMKLMIDRKTDQADNLTVMSCTLDASAKIYSCRVDNVYTSIQKFVNSYNTAKDKKGHNDSVRDDEAESDEEGDQQNNKKKKKSKLLKDRKRFIKDTESLNRKEVEVCYYGQNLPKNQTYFLESSVLDEGHELTLNRPLFLSHNPPTTCSKSTFTIDKIWQGDSIPLSNFDDKIYEDIRNKVFIADDRPEDEVQNMTENEFTFDPDVRDIAEMKNFNEIYEGESEHGDDGPQDIEVDYDDCDVSINNDDVDSIQVSHEPLPASVPATPMVSFTPVAMSRMLRISNNKSDYSYFDSSKLDFMPSATHWKIKASKRPITSVGKTPGKSRKVKQKFLDFFSTEEIVFSIERLEEDNGISHKLHTKTVKEWYSKRSDLVFAPILPNIRKKLLSFFKDPTLSVLSLVKSETKEYNANESVLLNPHEFTSQDNEIEADDNEDREGVYHPDEDWRDNDYDQPVNGEPEQKAGETGEDQQVNQVVEEKPADYLESLVAAPNRVEKVSVSYAKTQKRIDIKKLKSAIWNLLDLTNTNNENKENEKDKTRDSKKEVKYSDIFKRIPDSISKEAAAELSYPIAFMAILHMANEKSLKLTPTDNFQRDFTVCLDSPPLQRK